jgi:hypothetical protein
MIFNYNCGFLLAEYFKSMKLMPRCPEPETEDVEPGPSTLSNICKEHF